jgi:hypothetical protein
MKSVREQIKIVINAYNKAMAHKRKKDKRYGNVVGVAIQVPKSRLHHEIPFISEQLKHLNCTIEVKQEKTAFPGDKNTMFVWVNW